MATHIKLLNAYDIAVECGAPKTALNQEVFTWLQDTRFDVFTRNLGKKGGLVLVTQETANALRANYVWPKQTKRRMAAIEIDLEPSPEPVPPAEVKAEEPPLKLSGVMVGVPLRSTATEERSRETQLSARVEELERMVVDLDDRLKVVETHTPPPKPPTLEAKEPAPPKPERKPKVRVLLVGADSRVYNALLQEFGDTIKLHHESVFLGSVTRKGTWPIADVVVRMEKFMSHQQYQHIKLEYANTPQLCVRGSTGDALRQLRNWIRENWK